MIDVSMWPARSCSNTLATVRRIHDWRSPRRSCAEVMGMGMECDTMTILLARHYEELVADVLTIQAVSWTSDCLILI
jgi:hypothetical protein